MLLSSINAVTNLLRNLGGRTSLKPFRISFKGILVKSSTMHYCAVFSKAIHRFLAQFRDISKIRR